MSAPAKDDPPSLLPELCNNNLPVSVQGVRVLAAAGGKFHRTEFFETEQMKNPTRHIGRTCDTQL